MESTHQEPVRSASSVASAKSGPDVLVGAGEHRRHGAPAEGPHERELVAARSGEGHGLAGPVERLGRPTGGSPLPCRLAEQPGGQCLIGGVGTRLIDDPGTGNVDCRDGPRVAVGRGNSNGPVGQEVPGHPDGGPGRRLEAPLERSAEVLGVGVHPIEPVHHQRPDQLGRGGRRKIREGREVTIGKALHLAGLDELLAGVLADGLEHPVARRGPAVNEDEGSIDEPGQPVHQLELVHRRRAVADDPRRGIGGPAPGEDRQPAQETSIVLGQEIPAPVDQGVKRLLARDGRPPAAGQEPEPVAEAKGDVIGRHRRDARRSELDRQRDPIEAPADLGHAAHVRLGQREARIDRHGTLGEQLHGLGRRRGVEIIWRRGGCSPCGRRPSTGRRATSTGGPPRPTRPAPRGSW